MKENNWDIIISSKHKFFNLNFTEILNYKDLILMLVKRDFVTFYKQTILGPFWYLLQPLITSLVFTLIFGRVAQLSTDGVPSFLFYMSGTVAWNFFATSLNATSNTFLANSSIFSKVYFPRTVVPISIVINCFFQFLIQFSIFLFFLIYYFYLGFDLNITYLFLLLPFIIIQIALLGLGFGMLISSLTTKYRDLTFILTFGIQLWMFASPIVYPLSVIPEKYQILICLNPMTPIIETFKLCIFNNSSIGMLQILIGVFLTFFILIFGFFMFNKMERSFVDTI